MGSIKAAVYMMIMIVLIAADSDLHYFHNTQNKLSSTRMGFDMQPQLPTFLKKGHHFIIGGEYVDMIHKFPYMVFIYFAVPVQDITGYCGGTILSRKYVLTAAHCINVCTTDSGNISCTKVKIHDFTVFVGSTIPENALDKVKVKTYFIHPNYRKFDDLNKCVLNYDIAILELRTPLKFNNKISRVKLTTPQKTRLTMKNCKVIGWGDTQGGQQSRAFNTVFLRTKLKMATIRVISIKQCLKHSPWSIEPDGNGNSSIDPDIRYCTDATICAIDPKSKDGACHGDSGGPLICDGVQVGVLSGTVDDQCVGPHMPSIYTRVDLNLQWIHTITTV